MSHNDSKFYNYKKKNTSKISQDQNLNYEYWYKIERSERLSKQFEKEHNMCCFTIVISLLGCCFLPCVVYNKIYPEETNKNLM